MTWLTPCVCLALHADVLWPSPVGRAWWNASATMKLWHGCLCSTWRQWTGHGRCRMEAPVAPCRWLSLQVAVEPWSTSAGHNASCTYAASVPRFCRHARAGPAARGVYFMNMGGLFKEWSCLHRQSDDAPPVSWGAGPARPALTALHTHEVSHAHLRCSSPTQEQGLSTWREQQQRIHQHLPVYRRCALLQGCGDVLCRPARRAACSEAAQLMVMCSLQLAATSSVSNSVQRMPALDMRRSSPMLRTPSFPRTAANIATYTGVQGSRKICSLADGGSRCLPSILGLLDCTAAFGSWQKRRQHLIVLVDSPM